MGFAAEVMLIETRGFNIGSVLKGHEVDDLRDTAELATETDTQNIRSYVLCKYPCRSQIEIFVKQRDCNGTQIRI